MKLPRRWNQILRTFHSWVFTEIHHIQKVKPTYCLPLEECSGLIFLDQTKGLGGAISPIASSVRGMKRSGRWASSIAACPICRNWKIVYCGLPTCRPCYFIGREMLKKKNIYRSDRDKRTLDSDCTTTKSMY